MPSNKPEGRGLPPSTAVAAAIATVVFLALAVPPGPLPRLHWAAWTPLIWSQLRHPDWRIAALTPCIAYIALGTWFAAAVSDFAHLPMALTIPLTVLVVGATGLPYIPAFLAVPWLRERLGIAWTFAFAALFVVCEAVSDVVSLFPSSLAISQLDYRVLVQIVSVTGTSGLTFLMALCAALVADNLERLQNERPAAPVPWAIFAVLFLGNLGYGTWRFRAVEAELATAPTRRVAMVQSGIPMSEWKADKTAAGAYFIEATKALEAGSVDLVIWPEIAARPSLGRPERRKPRKSDVAATELVRELGTELISGTNTLRRMGKRPDGSWDDRLFNSAVLVTEDGVVGVHDKALLMPFSEYLPAKDWWPEPLYGFIAGLAGKYTPDGTITLLPAAGLKVGTPICYEALKTGHMQQYLEADLLAPITNDAWFGDTRAPHLSALTSALRSVELGRTQVRVGYSGLSFVGEPHGRVIERIEPFERESRVVTVRIAKIDTLYSRWGRWFVVLCALMAAAAVGWGSRREPETRP